MKKSVLFVLIAIVLITGDIARKEIYFGDDFHPILPWVITGFAAGVLYSIFWIFHCRPKSTRSPSFKFIFENRLFVINLSLLICMIFFSISIVDLAYSLKKTVLETATWPSVTATIVGQNIFEAASSRYRTPRWAATWSYTFAIADRNFQSHSRSVPLAAVFGFKFSEELARKDMDLHPIGSQITAYYNPLEPEQTVLTKKVYEPNKGYLLILIGSLLLICSVVGTVIVSQRIKARLGSTPADHAWYS